MITVHADELAFAIKRVRHAAATEPMRPILSTILFQAVDPDTIRLVAADNYRIATQDVKVGRSDDDDAGAMAIGRTPVDLTDIKWLLPFLAVHKRAAITITLSDDKRTMRFSTNWRSLDARVVDGTWPAYETVTDDARAKADRVALRPEFLTDVAKSLGKTTPAMTMRFGDPLHPVIIDTTDGYTETIMPVRTVEGK